ncbi:hypothetical protein E2C01_007877 [Portunus trituberculatus]|uniref:Uncharacterized protein n=1 Tax=Portunus trituberculatus TaxID=210409 RepID=A0A5B7D2D3_PORTR|nr:hypothetical protein [Portunus trituberculatus]
MVKKSFADGHQFSLQTGGTYNVVWAPLTCGMPLFTKGGPYTAFVTRSTDRRKACVIQSARTAYGCQRLTSSNPHHAQPTSMDGGVD